MEINRFKSLIETTNHVMQSNQEQLNEAPPLMGAAVQATKPIWSNWLGDAQKPPAQSRPSRNPSPTKQVVPGAAGRQRADFMKERQPGSPWDRDRGRRGPG